MQTATPRYLVLTVVLLIGAGLYAAFSQSHVPGVPRWPAEDALFTVDQWLASPQKVEVVNNTNQLTRVYRRADGGAAILTVITNQEPKLYGAGAEVPFLGNGYRVGPAPEELTALGSDGIHALVAQKDAERWLVLYAYGERRGLLGNGLQAWSHAVFDGLVGNQNDYYKLFLTVRSDGTDPRQEVEAATLARTIFPRIAGWYSA